MSVLALLASKAQEFADRPALSAREGGRWRTLAYRDVSRRAQSLASTLIARGLLPGDRVALLSEPRPEWGLGFFAVVRAGGILVPLDPRLTEPELRAVLSDAEPRFLLASPPLEPLARALHPYVLSTDLPEAPLEHPSRERRPDECIAIVYTSGTTGKPKGVMIGCGSLLFEASTLHRALGILPTDRFLSILPLNHLLELTGGFLTALYAGAEICYSPSIFPHEIEEFVREKQITVVLGVPALFARCALPCRLRVSGGAPLDPELARSKNILQGYGLTETSPVVSVNTPGANRIGSVGRPLDGVEVRIGDDGEILTRGPHLMQGYFRRADSPIDRDGWLHTGDRGRLDDDGYLWVTGRLKSLIVLPSGKKVEPEEVEAALSQDPAVREICVVGTSQVCAVVVSEEPLERVREILARLGRSLAPFKRPTDIRLHPGPLPRTASHKLRRDDVLKWIQA